MLKTVLPHKTSLKKPKEIWLQDQNVLWWSFYVDSLNSGSVAAIMDDEPVIKYAIKQGRKIQNTYQRNSKWSTSICR